MKLSIIFLLLPLSALADPIQLSCHAPATAFEIKTENEKVISTVNHPMGIEFTPMYSGNLPIVSIDRVLLQAEIVKKLGKSQTFTWPKEKCSFNQGHILYCTNGELIEINGVKIRPILLRSMNDHLTMPTGIFDVYNLAVVFLVENEPKLNNVMFTLTSNYYFARDCRIPLK